MSSLTLLRICSGMKPLFVFLFDLSVFSMAQSVPNAPVCDCPKIFDFVSVTLKTDYTDSRSINQTTLTINSGRPGRR
jgi:hypothetical protein